MSNAFIQKIGGGGGGGGADTMFTQDGTAVTIADAFIISGYDIPDNDISGITTKGGASTQSGLANQIDVDLTNRFHGAASYSDSATHILATLPITIANGVVRVNVIVCGYDTTLNVAATVEIVASYRFTGGSNFLLTNNYAEVQEDTLFVGTAFTAGTAGAINIEVSGNGTNTIEWVAVGTYVQVGT